MVWQYQNAVVVDDAFGPPPPGGVSGDDKNAWIDLVDSRNDTQAKLLNRFTALGCANLDALLERLTSDAEQLHALWETHEQGSDPDIGLEVLFKTESLNRKAKAEKANVVYETMKSLLGDDNVRTFSNLNDATQHLENADVAFVDFFLVEGESQDAALERIRNAAEILKKPKLLFFMSSVASLETQRRVRNLISVRSAFFEVMLKSEIDEERVRAKLQLKAAAYEGNLSIQMLVDELASNVKAAAEEFSTQCELLEIHDLRILNIMRLEAENETLSAYLTWLFSESLAAKTRRLSASLANQISIDPANIGFTGQILQGKVLFNLFSEVVFGPPQQQSAPIRFGEVFALADDATSFRLVLTPACDLARCELTRKVMCVIGTGRNFSDARSHASSRLYGRSRHLLVSTDPSRSELLTWDSDNVDLVSVSDLAGDHYKRIAVMNELYAQEVKEDVFRQLSRIGTQIDPPPAGALRVSVRWKVGTQLCEEITPSEEFLSALLTYAEQVQKPKQSAGVVLSDAFKSWIRRKVTDSHGVQPIPPKLANCLAALDTPYFPLTIPAMSWNLNGELYIQVAPVGTPQNSTSTMRGSLELTLWTED